ncbi:MAG: hypothetical protein JJ895_04890 [Balneolaceae bacterium]|nr:hypothetical protein [Balneolaceae bacterium]
MTAMLLIACNNTPDEKFKIVQSLSEFDSGSIRYVDYRGGTYSNLSSISRRVTIRVSFIEYGGKVMIGDKNAHLLKFDLELMNVEFPSDLQSPRTLNDEINLNTIGIFMQAREGVTISSQFFDESQTNSRLGGLTVNQLKNYEVLTAFSEEDWLKFETELNNVDSFIFIVREPENGPFYREDISVSTSG